VASAAVPDLSAQSFWQQDAAERDAAFAFLRAEHPISWHRVPETELVAPEEQTGGYWAVVRHEDVRHVSRHAELFCSGLGVLYEDVPRENLEATQSFLAMDAPRHTKVRGLVNAAFTPRQVARLEEGIATHAREIVGRLLEEREGDFVQTVSREMPMRMIAQMIGVPDSERDAVASHADALVSWNDAEYVGDRHPLEVITGGIMALTGIALELAAAREAQPTDDLMTALVTTEVDGERLTHPEIAAFFVLLAVAGNDTTRHTTSHAALALQDHPDQRAYLAEDPDTRLPIAVEEFIRWATPVMTFRRTATQDTELAGQAVAKGEKVVMFYTSANRDETVFEAPERFDVTRDPNRHAGFGGGGPHYCLGASFARTQLRQVFAELLERAPTLTLGEPERLVGNFINGIKRMPYSL
jgi:cytochrome P450